MAAPTVAKRFRPGLLAHLAPVALGWAYIILWSIFLDDSLVYSDLHAYFQRRQLHRLLAPLHFGIAGVVFFGGIWALWMRSPWAKITVLTASMLTVILFVFFFLPTGY